MFNTSFFQLQLKCLSYHIIRWQPKIFFLILCSFAFSSCDKQSDSIPTTVGDSSLPRFISTNYIELDKIARISKFRSGIGHDYWDDEEHCRSMKHYFMPKDSVDASLIKIFSPVSGSIVRIYDEWAGTQMQIQTTGSDPYTIIIFHVHLIKQLHVGDKISEGEQLGTHIGSQTYSDIAIGHSVNNKWRLVSYFEVMSDSLFQQYTARGISSRSDCIISKSARDADSLRCAGESFGTGGTIENWVELK